VHKHVEDLTQGVTVTYLNNEAQNQLRCLLELSQIKREQLVHCYIRRGLEVPEMSLRFENVESAHQATFRWLFPSPHERSIDNNRSGPISERVCSHIRQDSHELDKSSHARSKQITDPESSSTIDEKDTHQQDQGWSVWQLDDGYEEENQDWWYKREEKKDCVVTDGNFQQSRENDTGENWEDFESKPENRNIVEAGRRLIDWLSSGSGIFHISGKLGSGKSTLMKFLLKHPRTQMEISKWAGTCQSFEPPFFHAPMTYLHPLGKTRCVLSNFFFWKPGSRNQKSLSGLFRSLLYDISQTCSDLIEIAFPEKWHELMTYPGQAQPEVHFTDEEVRIAITTIFRNSDTYNKYSFCIFIDGLDEYQETFQEDYKSLIRILKEWTTLSANRIKICVSSREYNVFQNAFQADQRIRLQDLTRIDIERYAHHMLQDLENEAQKDRMVSEIVHRSDGIFLWVALVVKLFREYIEDDQDLTTFEAILESLPDELEDLFEYLLVTIRKPARKRAYQIFALMNEFKKRYDDQLFLLSCIFLEDYERNRLFATEPMPRYTHQHWVNLEATAQKRLNGYCRGLVETKEMASVGKYITFTHRSVPEFLEKESRQKEMAKHLVGFDLTDAIRQLYLAQLRSMRTTPGRMFWARFATDAVVEDFETCAPFPYLSCLESAIVERIGKMGTVEMDSSKPLDKEVMVFVGGAISWISKGQTNGNFFLASPFYLSAYFGKWEYVMWQIERIPALVNEAQKRAFLIDCVRSGLADHESKERFQEMMAQRGYPVEVLIDKKPNEKPT
jgi:hypothetical protein